MDDFFVDGGVVEFKPGSGWAWAAGWSGKVTASVKPHGLTSEGQSVALTADFERLALQLSGRPYTATGFDDIPGMVTVAVVQVDAGTLSSRVAIDGDAVGTAHTSGTFRVVCVPSFKAGAPPIPDPLLAKEGTWKVARCGQAAARADR